MTRDFRLKTVQSGQRLDDFLYTELSKLLNYGGSARVSKAKIRRLLFAGGVKLRGATPAKGGYRAAPPSPALILSQGQEVLVRIAEDMFFAEKDAGDISFELHASQILYEDEWLIAVNKPAGIPTDQGFVASRDHLHAATLRFLTKRAVSRLHDAIGIADAAGNAQNLEPYLGLHHRLDKETSGVVLFTKTKDANPGVHKLFAEHLVQKSYVALCGFTAGTTTSRTAVGTAKMKTAVDAVWRRKNLFTIENSIGRVSKKSEAAKWGALAKGGQKAITDFKILERGATFFYLEALPRTGRTHQIRVHLSSAGLPILGDSLYGGAVRVGKTSVPRVMLHALELRFLHPRDGSNVTIHAPLPQDFTDILALLKT